MTRILLSRLFEKGGAATGTGRLWKRLQSSLSPVRRYMKDDFPYSTGKQSMRVGSSTYEIAQPIPRAHVMKEIPVFRAPPSARFACKDPVAVVNASQIATLDPTGKRSKLFSPRNPDAVKVGDVLLVRHKNGDPFAGVLISIRRRGVDSAILMRNTLTRVGVEMWYKIYSPNVKGIEVVQRRRKRARRARLTYMRLPKHDLGSVENIVQRYVQERAALGIRTPGLEKPSNNPQSKRGKN